MARRGLPPEERLRLAIDGTRRMAFRGERPTFHLRPVDGGFRIIELELVVEDLAVARDRIRQLLVDVPDELYQVEVERRL